MLRGWTAARIAPLIAGLSGLAWFWFELEPQRRGFEDTDNPAIGLQFIAAYPQAWPLAGLALTIAAVALVAAVIATRSRLEAVAPGDTGMAVRTVAVIGLFAALFLLGQALLRFRGGPVRYVANLEQGWGETAYLVTQFVGQQLFGVGGLMLLAMWAIGVAWHGARRGVIPKTVAILAILPAIRVSAIPGLVSVLPEGLWLVWALGIPATFVWLALLGAWPAPSVRQATATPAPLLPHREAASL
jgi:hypothetical protein